MGSKRIVNVILLLPKEKNSFREKKNLILGYGVKKVLYLFFRNWLDNYCNTCLILATSKNM